MAKLKFEVPGADTPGFLRRQKKLIQYLEIPDEDSRKWEVLVDLLLEYVVSPKNREMAEKAIWEMSQNEYSDALALISNQGEVDPNT